MAVIMKIEIGDLIHLVGRIVEVSKDRIAVTIEGYNGRPIGINLRDLEVRFVMEEVAEAAE
jgi:hypothetical protein